MNLDSFPFLDHGPLLLKFLHHLAPHEHVLSVLLLDAFLRLLLENIEPESLLNLGRF